MSKWIDLNLAERKVILQSVEDKEKLQQAAAIEKDWWVTAVLKALFQTSCKEAISFKGGTSLSKGWNIIERLSEDIDIALDHSFFGMERTNKYQRDNLCRKARSFVITTLKEEIEARLTEMGINGFSIEAVTERQTKDGPVHINSNTDPTVLLVNYESVLDTPVDYIQSRVKIEIGCLAMDEPTEQRKIDTLISSYFPDEDNELACTIRTVVPTRTFLEKLFLLSEEFQKAKPRHKRMSRHLYDLERLMDTKFGVEAIADTALYNSIVEHRKAYYDLKYIDYDLHAPEKINFIPPKEEIDKWRNDYDEMQRNFIFGAALPFDKLLQRMEVLKNRLRQQSGNLK